MEDEIVMYTYVYSASMTTDKCNNTAAVGMISQLAFSHFKEEIVEHLLQLANLAAEKNPRLSFLIVLFLDISSKVIHISEYTLKHSGCNTATRAVIHARIFNT